MSKYEKNPMVFIEDTSHRGWYYPRTGWDLDNRGADSDPCLDGIERRISSVLTDMPTTFKRDITEQFCGTITFEAVYSIREGNGFYMSFGNENDYMLKLVQRGTAFYIDDTKAFDISYGRHYIKISIDMEKGTVSINSDKKFAGLFRVNGKADSISRFV